MGGGSIHNSSINSINKRLGNVYQAPGNVLHASHGPLPGRALLIALINTLLSYNNGLHVLHRLLVCTAAGSIALKNTLVSYNNGLHVLHRLLLLVCTREASTASTNSLATLGMPHVDLRVCNINTCLLYTSPSPRDQRGSRMPSSA